MASKPCCRGPCPSGDGGGRTKDLLFAPPQAGRGTVESPAQGQEGKVDVPLAFITCQVRTVRTSQGSWPLDFPEVQTFSGAWVCCGVPISVSGGGSMMSLPWTALCWC